MPDAQPTNANEELGAVLTVRQRRAFYFARAALTGIASAALLVLGSVRLVRFFSSIGAGGPNLISSWQAPVLLVGFGIAGVVFTITSIKLARTTVTFRELGAVQTRGRSRTVIPYTEATEFVMNLDHQSTHGIYLGTIVRMWLRAPDKRSISFTGRYKVRTRGIFFQRSFEVLDELDRVRATIAEQMADSLVERMLAGHSIDWCGETMITPEGLLPSRGRHRGELITYAEIEHQEMDEKALRMFAAGVRRPSVIIETAGTNFWPCYAAFLRLAERSALAIPYPGTPSEDGDDIEDDD